MGNMLVSSCRCCVLVSRVHPVVLCCDVFCMVCILFVFDIIGNQIVLPYSSVVLMMAVYVLGSASLYFSQCVAASTFSIFGVFFALFVVLCESVSGVQC